MHAEEALRQAVDHVWYFTKALIFHRSYLLLHDDTCADISKEKSEKGELPEESVCWGRTSLNDVSSPRAQLSEEAVVSSWGAHGQTPWLDTPRDNPVRHSGQTPHQATNSQTAPQASEATGCDG